MDCKNDRAYSAAGPSVWNDTDELRLLKLGKQYRSFFSNPY